MINLKLLSLGILVIQNSSLVLVIKYYRNLSSSLPTSNLVFMAEIVKLVVSIVLYARESKGPLHIIKDLNLLSRIQSPLVIRKYVPEKCKVNLPEEYLKILNK